MRALLAIAGFCALAAAAQPAPQLTWEGQVDGIVVLHIHGRKLEVEYKQGKPVERQRVQFHNALPDTRQNVRVEVREGRGSVTVSGQPRIENDFSADVTIEDLQEGASFYSIAVYWDASDVLEERQAPMDHVTWSGRVDGEVVVVCGASRCESQAREGQTVGREKFKFTRPLPASEVRVTLDETSGRADIRILEQPSVRNQYRASVVLRALKGSAGPCSFVLSWPRPRK